MCASVLALCRDAFLLTMIKRSGFSENSIEIFSFFFFCGFPGVEMFLINCLVCADFRSPPRLSCTLSLFQTWRHFRNHYPASLFQQIKTAGSEESVSQLKKKNENFQLQQTKEDHLPLSVSWEKWRKVALKATHIS